jgi:hypothetical protein
MEPPDADAPISSSAEGGSAVALWLTSASRRRLLDAVPLTLIEDPERADEADLIIVSTRIPPGGDLRGLQIWDRPERVMVLAHLGGERVALEMLRLGARGLVAEGNEAAIAKFGSGSGDEILLAEFAARMGEPGASSGTTRDPVMGLPGPAAFELRLSELTRDGALPRIALMELSGLTGLGPALGKVASEALGRRLASVLGEHARHSGAELYALTDRRLATIGPEQGKKRAGQMARSMVELASGFTPTGAALVVAIGLAGSEEASDVAGILHLAERALEVAKTAPGQAVVDADSLVESSAAGVEYETAIATADAVDALDPRGAGHSQRVAELARRLAGVLGLDENQVGLAARLHNVGKVGMPPETHQPPHPDFVTHSLRGEDLVRISAGPEVAAMVRSHHERWDGSGLPDGLIGESIPFGARVLAVADFCDREDAALALPEESGRAFDPTVVAAAIELLG